MFSGNLRQREEYIKARKKVNRTNKRRIEMMIAKEVSSNPKSFWNYVKSKMKVRTSKADIRETGGCLVTEDGRKAEILNEFFKKAFTVEDKTSFPQISHKYKLNTKFREIEFDKYQVEKHLRTLKPSKSPGEDNISNDILRNVAKSIAIPLTILFNKSMKEETVRLDWKKANVIPIYKKGDRHLAALLLFHVKCKVMESIIKKKMADHLEINNLLSDRQYGFRSRRSCTLQLLEVADQWSRALDYGKPIDSIYLDLRKAFDSVPHDKLIQKLKATGIMGNILNWLKDFLRNRIQRVSVNGEKSEWSDVISGVLQGSVIGPIMFLIHINDLPDGIKSHMGLFADDAKLYAEIENKEQAEIMQDDLERLNTWSNKWQLEFNIRKC